MGATFLAFLNEIMKKFIHAACFFFYAIGFYFAGGAVFAHAQLLTGFDEPSVVQPSYSARTYEAPVYDTPQTIERQETPEYGRPLEPKLYSDEKIVRNSADETPFWIENEEKMVDLSPVAQPMSGFTAALPNVADTEQPVDLQADDLSYDESGRFVTATGNVMMAQAGRILRADVVTYDVNADKITARGNVVLNDVTGDVYLAEEVELSNRLKDGMVQGLRTMLADGSRFMAASGTRSEGVETVMEDATYTACEVCEENPEADPVWQIRAAEMTHDAEEHTVSYKHARFELAGVPVFYTPYLSHSDGSVKRKSGFLTPSGGFRSNLGTFVKTRYYWDVAPDKDATIGVMAMTQEAPLLEGQWRQRWGSAAAVIDGGVTYSQRTDSVSGVAVQKDEELRGHVFAEGLWDMNEKWRSGVRVNWASDDQYLRQYDLDREDVLENEVYAERFSGRNYAVGRLLTFQDIRVAEERSLDQPEVLPEIITSFIGEPGSMPVLGGRWQVQGSFLGLQRDGSDQDLNRLSGNLGWKRRLVSDYGVVSDASVSLRGDLYSSRDLESAVSDPTRDDSATESRFFPQAHIQSSYPVAKQFDSSQVTVEPIAALTFAPNINVNEDIPNEDSQDVQIDANNIFEPNRFPGLDRVEDQSRVTYGVRTGIYGDNGDLANVFLGQSRRFSDDDNPFPEGSGLDDQESDYVGQVRFIYQGNNRLDYRFELDHDGLASQRHEVDATTKVLNRLDLNLNYLFAKALDGTDIDESREQLRLGSALLVHPEWRILAGGTQDLGAQPGLRRVYTGLDYLGQCISWSILGQRNLTDDVSGESDTEILFRVGLKNLGEFTSSGL